MIFKGVNIILIKISSVQKLIQISRLFRELSSSMSRIKKSVCTTAIVWWYISSTAQNIYYFRTKDISTETIYILVRMVILPIMHNCSLHYCNEESRRYIRVIFSCRLKLINEAKITWYSITACGKTLYVIEDNVYVQNWNLK